MAHINVPENIPGIRSLVLFRPETGAPLYDLAQALLRGPSSLSPAERELIAAAVSKENECRFCCSSHAAAARVLFGDESAVVDEVLEKKSAAATGEKIGRLLEIARKTAHSGLQVSAKDIELAREAGADDTAIHDTVLIAATFSLFNRYVDGLDSLTPKDEAEYAPMGVRLAGHGYAFPKTAQP